MTSLIAQCLFGLATLYMLWRIDQNTGKKHKKIKFKWPRLNQRTLNTIRDLCYVALALAPGTIIQLTLGLGASLIAFVLATLITGYTQLLWKWEATEANLSEAQRNVEALNKTTIDFATRLKVIENYTDPGLLEIARNEANRKVWVQ